jgi:folylpolyglutamate synthase/dihydropteroate synthase
MITLSASESAKAVVRRNTQEIKIEGRFEVFEELFANDFVDHTPQFNGATNKAAVAALYRGLREAFPESGVIPAANPRLLP